MVKIKKLNWVSYIIQGVDATSSRFYQHICQWQMSKFTNKLAYLSHNYRFVNIPKLEKLIGEFYLSPKANVLIKSTTGIKLRKYTTTIKLARA